jgi:hypothetical protein
MVKPFRYLLWLVLSTGLFLALDTALIAASG